MATENNAPMPIGSGAAEVFDSTVAPATGNISQIGLPGPPTTEAPQHAGMINGIDPYFYRQYIALDQIIWDTTMSPAQLIFSMPITPQRSHQYMAHLAKMYNTWAGGFDFAVKVAGTGFHAGAIMIVRLPPNIPPSSLRTLADITAFEYTVIDPKTLEVEIKAVMDQRNIMYHYLPLDITNHQTFGGWFAIYVMLPLNTSSTGATQIGIQILTKPAQAPPFMFAQIRPLQLQQVIVSVPEDLIAAFDFMLPKSALLISEQLTSMTAWSLKSKRELDRETVNAVDFSGEPMNGFFTPRLQTINKFELTQIEDFGTSQIQYQNDSTGDGVHLSFPAGDSGIYWKHLLFETTETDGYYPPIEDTDGQMSVEVLSSDKVRSRTWVFTGKFSIVDPPDPKYPGAMSKFVLTNVTSSGTNEFRYDGWSPGSFVHTVTNGDELGKDTNIKFVSFEFQDLKFKFDYKKYAPPISESIITFQSSSGESAQPYEIAQILRQGKYSKLLTKNDSIIFELYDTLVNLPILPMRLSYTGLITTILQKSDLIYKFTSPKRYNAVFIGIIPITTPILSGRLPLQNMPTYALNNALSRSAR